jgi:cell wall-associated NlpC family hydrolase
VRYRNQQARRGAATAAAAALLLVLWTATGASADQGTPSAGTIAKAKAKVSAVAAQVGVMQAQLAAAEGKLQALGQAVDAAGEAYNGAMYKLQQAQDAAGAAQRAAGNAADHVAAARRDVGIIAAAVYRGGGGADLGLGALVSASSPENALSDVGILDVLANRQSGVMDRMRASQVVAQVLNKQAGDALANVNRAAAAAAAAKAAVEAKVAAQSSQVTALNAQVAQLNQALTAARAQSTQLTHARAVGLAKAAAALAAAKKAAREAAAKKHGHGSTGGSSGGSGGGGQATSAGAAAAIAFAKAQLGDPYQWGATGPSTWDCSGLTMRAWAAGGVTLPHWSVAQWASSVPVSESNARPGDLVFFAYNSGDYHSIHHVALYLGGGLMIEAPFTGSWVRISHVSDQPDLFGYARP